MRRRFALLFVVGLTIGSRSAALGLPAPREPIRIIGYFSEDNAVTTGYSLKTVANSGAAALMTQLNYAFGRVAHNRCRIADSAVAVDHAYSAAESVDGTDDPVGDKHLRGTFHQLLELKRKYPGLKVVISLGGWNQSQGFSMAARSANVRGFVRSCVDIFIQGHLGHGIEAPGLFDGIDIDWEYPVQGGNGGGGAADKKNFTAMIAEFRRQMDAVRPGLILSAAVPAIAELYGNFELGQVSSYLSEVGVMAYDLHWSTERVTNLHSALFHDPADPSAPPLDKHYADYAVRLLIETGVPAEKIVLGVPFYGKGWTGVADVNHGLYQRASGAASELAFKDLTQMAAADRQFYPSLATCSIWQSGSFWSFDCPEALQAKLDYVRRNGLGGIMFWDLTQDTNESELLRTLASH